MSHHDHADDHPHGHDPETLRRQIDVRRQVIEKTLSQMDSHADERHALEGKLRELESILGQGNWEHLPPRTLAELCAWLDKPLP